MWFAYSSGLEKRISRRPGWWCKRIAFSFLQLSSLIMASRLMYVLHSCINIQFVTASLCFEMKNLSLRLEIKIINTGTGNSWTLLSIQERIFHFNFCCSVHFVQSHYALRDNIILLIDKVTLGDKTAERKEKNKTSTKAESWGRAKIISTQNV